MLPWTTSVAVRNVPFVTWALILANVLVFLFEVSLPPPLGEAFVVQYGLVPARYSDPAWALAHGLDPGDYLPFLTTVFLHGGWLHLILNMWTLWIFGPAIEDRLGPVRYLGFFLVCGLGASLAHALVNSASTIPAVGASGAIAGVMGAFMRLFPMSRVVVLIPILFIPLFFEFYAFIFVGFWMAMQLLQGIAGLFEPPQLGGVAWWAHIGGFAVGWTVTGWLSLSRSRYRLPQPDEGFMGFAPDGRRPNRHNPHRKGPWE